MIYRNTNRISAYKVLNMSTEICRNMPCINGAICGVQHDS